jgi:hypothetical protein
MTPADDVGKGIAAGPSFAIPAVPVGSAGGGNEKFAPLVMGKNIFQNQQENMNSYSFDFEKKMKNLKQAGIDQNLRKIPTGVQAPKPSDSLPSKKTSPISPGEPDAVPSKTYDAILLNKKKQEKAGTIGGIASGQAEIECGSFSIKGIIGSSAQSIRKMSTPCPSLQ